MLYRASDTIVAEHPELSDQIRSVDAYLHDRQGQLFRPERAADFLDMEPAALKRLLELYEARGVVESVKVWICPEEGEILEPDEDGALSCDICDTVYQPDDCGTEIAYRPRPSLPTAPAPSAMPFTHGYALILGVGAYRLLHPLAKTTIDAHDLYDLLAQSGYPAANLALLLDEQATKAGINDKMDWLARSAGSDDTVLVFFSGHGAQRIGGFEPGEYLCPVEADWYNLRSTAISDEELTTALQAIRARRVVVFLDACHSGGVGEPKDSNLAIKAGLSEAAYERLATGGGRVVMASCKPDEVSWELPGMRNGLFTHYLLEGLRGTAAGDDGAVRIFNLFDYVSKQVPQHKPQHPLFKGEIELNFAIVLAGGEMAKPFPPNAPVITDRVEDAQQPSQPVYSRGERAFQLRQLIQAMIDLLDVYSSGYLLISDEKLQHLYLKAVLSIESFLKFDGFEDVRNEYSRPFQSLEEWEDIDIGWQDFLRPKMARAKGLVDEIWIAEGEPRWQDPQLERRIKELYEYLVEYKAYKARQEQAWVKRM